jgi:hypothetical protein
VIKTKETLIDIEAKLNKNIIQKNYISGAYNE